MRRPTAFTIAEVLVAATILGLLTGVGILLLKMGATSRQQQDRNLESYTQGRQAVARLRREMRGAKVLEPTLEENVAGVLVYSYPLLVDDVLQVDAAGRTKWAGEARIFQDGNSLKLEKPLGGPAQLLARLEDGEFRAERTPSFVTLTVKVGGSERPGERFVRSFRIASP